MLVGLALEYGGNEQQLLGIDHEAAKSLREEEKKAFNLFCESSCMRNMVATTFRRQARACCKHIDMVILLFLPKTQTSIIATTHTAPPYSSTT